jgi:hypothetical protein
MRWVGDLVHAEVLAHQGAQLHAVQSAPSGGVVVVAHDHDGIRVVPGRTNEPSRDDLDALGQGTK